MLSLVALGAVAVAIAYATIQPPAPNDLANAQASIVYYDDGKTELARLSDAQGNRESVPLSKVPDHVQKAVLAAEDRDFYTNPGFSPTGIARSVVAGAAGRRRPGRRLDDHPAVREELLPHVRPLADPEVQGDHHLRQDRPAAGQGPDPRELPQHDLLRPRRLRHPDRVQGVLQQGRQPAERGRGRHPGRHRQRAVAATTPRSATSRRPTSRPGSPTSSTAWWPRAG